jgi:hypothetical protein
MGDRRVRRTATRTTGLAVVAVLFALACGQSTAPSALAPTTLEPSPSAEATNLATFEQAGIVVSIRLDRDPMPAGEPTWLTTEVRNTGQDSLVWLHGGCAVTVGVEGIMRAAEWRPGIPQEGVAGEFKRMTLSYQNLEARAVYIRFALEQFIGKGRIGCADLGIIETILPGDRIVQRAQWDGQAHLRLGLPPSGPVDLFGIACCYWRERDGEPEDVEAEARILLRDEAEIVDGRDRSLLDPPEVIDAALTDPAFVEWLETKDLGSGHHPVLWLDPEADLWEVGLLEYDIDRFHVALVHPRTGEVVRIIERPWDPDVDGSP